MFSLDKSFIKHSKLVETQTRRVRLQAEARRVLMYIMY